MYPARGGTRSTPIVAILAASAMRRLGTWDRQWPRYAAGASTTIGVSPMPTANPLTLMPVPAASPRANSGR